MAGFDDITKKAQAFLKNPKVKDALRSEKAEGISDTVLGKVSGAVDKATGGKFSGQIQSARNEADKRLGDRGVGRPKGERGRDGKGRADGEGRAGGEGRADGEGRAGGAGRAGGESRSRRHADGDGPGK